MDDESIKRRERLKAMRSEAAEAEVSCNITVDTHQDRSPGFLSNPLIEETNDTKLCTTTRFDYYTDPMAAFSGNKRRNMDISGVQDCNTPPINTPIQIPRFPSSSQGPRNHVRTVLPSHQLPADYYPDQRMWQARGPIYSHGPHISSPGMVNPFHIPPENPEVWNGPRGRPSYSVPCNQSRGNIFPRHAMGQMVGPRLGRNQLQDNHISGYVGSPNPGAGRGSPYPSSGRGRGRGGQGMRPGFERSGGRGGHFSEAEKLLPEKYYQKSMLEDPWKFLTPGIWKMVDDPSSSLKAPNYSASSIKQSVSTKKPKILEALYKPIPHQSLSEYLASSFSEAKND